MFSSFEIVSRRKKGENQNIDEIFNSLAFQCLRFASSFAGQVARKTLFRASSSPFCCPCGQVLPFLLPCRAEVSLSLPLSPSLRDGEKESIGAHFLRL
ncbi:hypothetical protein P8452_11033 [Trifolium repens]|nr:hypothetical protein P8452_11033 [Trifolium repens]